jgi:hemolysin activation/secretion protein
MGVWWGAFCGRVRIGPWSDGAAFWLLLSAYLLLSLWASGAALAQEPTPGDINQLLQQQRQILQQQEERRREQLDKLRKGVAPPKEDAQRDEAVGQKPPRCMPVNKILFDGAELLEDETKTALQKPFAGKCMTIVDIMAVVRVVTNWYVEQGFVTARAYPPEQDLSKGTLTIKVIEGKTESLGIYENGEPRRGLDNAFPHLVGTRLYIRDVEQGLDQINRLPTHDATIRIEPGEQEGYSKLRVDTKKSILPYVTSSVDNHGLKSTGEWETGTSLYVDDALGLHDGWVLSYKDSDPFYEGWQEARELSASVSLPFGYWTLLLSGSHFDYKSLLKGQYNTFHTDGVSTYYTAELDRVIHRDRDSKTRLTAFLNYKDIENSVEDIRLVTGSRALNVIGGRLSHSHRLWGGLLDASAGLHRGVPMFSSLTDEESLPGSPIAEFTKVSGDVSYYRPFGLEGINLAWLTRASGQWSSDDLYSSEQITMGSLYTVRGFKDQSLIGDTGAYVRNELIWTLPQLLPEEVKPVFGHLSLYAACDAGVLKTDEDEAFERGSVSGAAVGARLSGGLLIAEVAYERPLEAPDFIKKENQLRVQAGVSVKW